jgi:transposase
VGLRVTSAAFFAARCWTGASFESIFVADAEAAVIRPEVAAEIVRLYTLEGWKVGTIARQLGVHHSTVTRALQRRGVQRQGTRRPSMIDRFIPFIRETLRQYPTLPASVLYRMVRARGYPGGEDHFRHRIAELRPRRPAEAYLELRTLPGEQAQVDWASFGTWAVEGGERRLSAFVMVLSYSRMIFTRFFYDQRLSSFLEGHVRAFSFFQAATKTVLYDNLKSAVLERRGDAIRFHPSMLSLAAHYRFQPRPVTVGRGNEKGRVERAIGYLRSSFFRGLSFADIDELNLKAELFCNQVSPSRPWPQQKSLSVAEAFAKERPYLIELPGDPFPAAERVDVAVGRTPYVRFDSNRYSVPHTRVRRTLTLRADSRRIRIFDRSELVAEHQRCWDKHQVVENPDHIATLRRHKRRARLQRGQERLLRAVPACETLLAEMGKRQRRLNTAVDRLTILLEQFGAAELAIAVGEAIDKGSPHPETVRLVLDRRRRARQLSPSVPVRLPDSPAVRDIVVTPHSLSDYDPPDDEEKEASHE